MTDWLLNPVFDAALMRSFRKWMEWEHSA